MALRKSGRPLLDRGAAEHRGGRGGGCAAEEPFPLKLFPSRRKCGREPNERWIKQHLCHFGREKNIIMLLLRCHS